MPSKPCADCGKPTEYDRCFDCYKKKNAQPKPEKEFVPGEWTPTDSMADNLYALRTLAEFALNQSGYKLQKNPETKRYEVVPK